MALKNLHALELGGGQVLEYGSVVRVCRDEDRDRLVFLLDDGSILVHAADGTQVLETVRLPAAEVTAWTWAPEKQAILFGTRSGDLSMVLLQGESTGTVSAELEEIGCLEGGVLAAAWSPDEARLAVVTGSNRLLLMSEDWVPLEETAIDEVWVSIGSAAIEWRADGACFATATAPGKSAAHGLAIWDGQTGALEARGEPTPGLTGVLSWQPNGRHLYAVQSKKVTATASLDDSRTTDAGTAAAAGSEVRTGDAMLTGAGRSEQAPAASTQAATTSTSSNNSSKPLSKHVAAWKREERRRAAAAAAVQMATSGACPHAVLLFERNGLRHGGWDVPAVSGNPEAECIADMRWSPGSDILALAVDVGGGGDDKQHQRGPTTTTSNDARAESTCAVQLWTRHNWHWYCKSERRYCNAHVKAVCWTGHTTLAALTRNGDVLRQRLAWAHDTSPLGSVVVVDHGRLGLTPLRVSAPPPPLCTATARLPAAVLCTSLHSAPGCPERVAAILADGRLAMCQARRDDDWGDGPLGAGEDAMPSGRRAIGVGAGMSQRRAVERGAELVSAPLGRDYAVLVMPRGNLERVHPRALALAALARLCAARRWAAALRYALERRVDLNVLADSAWPRFPKSAAEVLADVADDAAVADLLSSLRPGSVLEAGGVYAGCDEFSGDGDGNHERGPLNDDALSSPDQVAPPPSSEDKVATVCGAIRAAIEAGPGVRYLRTLLVSHARCGDLEAALHLLKRMKDLEAGVVGVENPSAAPSTPDPYSSMPIPSAESGLRHLLLTSSEDTLYRTALGMYELDLAYFVVAHSQKDPGEYLQELAGFAAVPVGPRRRAAIDEHLGRHASALGNLVAADTSDCFDRALGLATKHGLLRTLCALCSEGSAQRSAALTALGAALADRGRHEDAGMAYLAAGKRDQALDAYVAGAHWRGALSLAAELGRDADELKGLACELADDLATRGRPAEAAMLRLEYARDVDAAVPLLAAAGEWREAWRAARTRRRGDLITSTLAPTAARRAQEILADAEESAVRVTKYRTRMESLAQRRRDLALAVGKDDDDENAAGYGDDGINNDDAASTCSVVSGLSAYTDTTTTASAAPSARSATSAASTVGGRRRQSAKSKRKATTNRVRQGSPEEEDQLARILLSLAPSAGLCTEVGQLTELLVMLGHEQDARVLQRAVGDLVTAQADAAATILASPPPGMRDPERPDKPSDDLRLQVLQQGIEAKAAAWKWDLLRNPEV